MSRRNRHFSDYDTICVESDPSGAWNFNGLPYGQAFTQLDQYYLFYDLDYCEPENFYLRYDKGTFEGPYKI